MATRKSINPINHHYHHQPISNISKSIKEYACISSYQSHCRRNGKSIKSKSGIKRNENENKYV